MLWSELHAGAGGILGSGAVDKSVGELSRAGTRLPSGTAMAGKFAAGAGRVSKMLHGALINLSVFNVCIQSVA